MRPMVLSEAANIEANPGIWYHSRSGTNALANVGPQPTFFVVWSRARAAVRIHVENRGLRDAHRITSQGGTRDEE
jgi:hypothetical protein